MLDATHSIRMAAKLSGLTAHVIRIWEKRYGAVTPTRTATNAGWRVTYLGSSLRAAEIAGAVAQNGCGALALSIVYSTDGPNLQGELSALRSFLPAETRIVVGGRAAGGYSEALKSIQASRVEDLNQFTAWLDPFRSI